MGKGYAAKAAAVVSIAPGSMNKRQQTAHDTAMRELGKQHQSSLRALVAAFESALGAGDIRELEKAMFLVVAHAETIEDEIAFVHDKVRKSLGMSSLLDDCDD